jgi:SAM-dependent methyltransferase
MADSSSSHQATLDRILEHAGDHETPKQLFAGVSDEFWFWVFTEGARRNAERLGTLLPGLPPDDVQNRFTGASGDVALTEAFSVYQLVGRQVAAHLDRPLESVLDYGCGWGRIIRFFLRDVEPSNLWGIDCFPQMIELCQATNQWSRFLLVDPFPPTSIEPERFDLVYAYSVFSHLSEDAHLAWLREFQRILKPGGVVVATTRAREFILMCAALRANQDRRFWVQGPASSFIDTEDALARYDRGEFLYEPVGGGDVLAPSFFGETCIPRQYAEQRWSEFFDVLDYIDDRRQSIQNVIVARKRR